MHDNLFRRRHEGVVKRIRETLSYPELQTSGDHGPLGKRRFLVRAVWMETVSSGESKLFPPVKARRDRGRPLRTVL